MASALEGIRILDFSRFGAGPLCPRILADLGAEVIRVERSKGEADRTMPPYTPGGDSLFFGETSRHKKCITLNLGNERGREILKELVKCGDVLVHNFPPETKQAKTLAYENLKEANPAIIAVSMTGFGLSGPYSPRSGFDGVAQAMSGIMSFTGFPGDPPTRWGVAGVDWCSGLYATIAVLAALRYREKTGQGQLIDASLLDSAIDLAAGLGIYADYQLNNVVRSQLGNQGWYVSSNLYKTTDGWLYIGMAVNEQWERFCKVIGKEEWIGDPNFKSPLSRFKNKDVTNPYIEQWMSERTCEEVNRMMEEAYVPCGEVYTVDRVLTDPHVKERGMLVEIESPNGEPILAAGFPVKLSLTPAKVEGPIPQLGEHNDEVYGKLLGFSPEEILQFRENGAL